MPSEVRKLSFLHVLESIVLVPPGGFAQARYLCKKLRARFPTLPIVVGCWGGTEAETLARLRLDSRTQVSTALTETRQQIMQVPPLYAPCGPHCTERGLGHTQGENHDAQRLVGTPQRDLECLEYR